MKFHKGYLLGFLLLFAVEAAIATFFQGNFIRAHLGDLLIVMLIYCFLRGTTKLSVLAAAGLVLLIAFAFELGQYFHVLKLFGWEDEKWAHLVFGKKFDPVDLGMYAAGVALTLALEFLRSKRSLKK